MVRCMRQQIVDGEAQGPVGRLGHLRGHVVPPRTLRRVYTGATTDPLAGEAGTTAAGRGVALDDGGAGRLVHPREGSLLA